MLGKIIKEYRMRNRLTQKEFGDRAQCSGQYISQLENDRPFLPSISTLNNLARALEMPLNDLLAYTYIKDEDYFKTYISEEEFENRKKLLGVNYENQ